jgi:hypothetical protein
VEFPATLALRPCPPLRSAIGAVPRSENANTFLSIDDAIVRQIEHRRASDLLVLALPGRAFKRAESGRAYLHIILEAEVVMSLIDQAMKANEQFAKKYDSKLGAKSYCG